MYGAADEIAEIAAPVSGMPAEGAEEQAMAETGGLGMHRGHRVIAGCLAAAVAFGDLPAASAEAAAADAVIAAPPALSAWERAAYKTLTFQTVANLADAALFAAISGTGAGTGAVFLAANTASAAALYYPYELAWDVFGPTPDASGPRTLAAKTVGYQVLTSARNVALSYAFTGALLPSAGFAAAAFALDSAIYAGNELAWDAFRPRPGP